MKTNLQRIKNDIEKLSCFSACYGKGITRFSFTKEDKLARDYIKDQMLSMGLAVYEDAAGTIVGRLDGINKTAPVIILGSHFDTVKNGGKFDGVAGVVAALEVARVLKENAMELIYPIEVIAMVEEEGARFGKGVFASRTMVGNVTQQELETSRDSNGVSLSEAMDKFGFKSYNIKQAIRKPESLKAFLELHIEQGPLLDLNNNDIGIVKSIVGVNQIEITVKGRADHSGTTPMHIRCDALEAASHVISRISTFALEAGDGTVATVGAIDVFPCATNIIPGEVKFTVDIRSINEECICYVIDRIKGILKQLHLQKEITYLIANKITVTPVTLDVAISQDIVKICNELNLKSEIMTSGAAHDAMVMASITNTGLIFVKSKNGRSHCPEEWTDFEDIQKGTEVLLQEVINLGSR